jgi:hypothetical protein
VFVLLKREETERRERRKERKKEKKRKEKNENNVENQDDTNGHSCVEEECSSEHQKGVVDGAHAAADQRK